MNAHQIALVQSSWKEIKPLGPAAGELFYSKLFETAPSVRHMFKPDVKPQASKLIYMLDYVVIKLNHLDTLVDDVRKLAIRHVDYGAQPAHYQVVGQVLIATLKEAMGSKWNEELQQAWISAYTILSETMISAQEEYQAKRA